MVVCADDDEAGARRILFGGSLAVAIRSTLIAMDCGGEFQSQVILTHGDDDDDEDDCGPLRLALFNSMEELSGMVCKRIVKKYVEHFCGSLNIDINSMYYEYGLGGVDNILSNEME